MGERFEAVLFRVRSDLQIMQSTLYMQRVLLAKRIAALRKLQLKAARAKDEAAMLVGNVKGKPPDKCV